MWSSVKPARRNWGTIWCARANYGILRFLDQVLYTTSSRKGDIGKLACQMHRRSKGAPRIVADSDGGTAPPAGLRHFPNGALSGKAMARTGLRMMPTFPLLPLKFRTAGFPRYGFKAGLSDEAFPAHWFAIVLRALHCHHDSLLCVRDDALISASVRAGQPLYPRSRPSLRSGLYCPGPSIAYPAPSAPLAGTSRLHRLAAYTRCPRCAYSHMPRRPTTGSELSSMIFHNVSSSETTGNSSAALPSTSPKAMAFNSSQEFRYSRYPHTPILVREIVSRLYYGSLALRPAALLALLFGADQICIQPTRTFTSGLPTVWSPAPSPDITTVPTGKLALAGLSPARTSNSFTALTG